jgi:hypothetical protein
VPWYYRVKAAINAAAMPFLAPTQKVNLALLVVVPQGTVVEPWS